MENLFDLIAGLPIHPLVDHFVVTLVPLFALMHILIVLKPKLKEKYGWVTVGGLAVALAASAIAKSSGESLALRVGFPADHAQQGEALVLVVIALFGASAYWMVFTELFEAPTALLRKITPMIGKASISIALGAIAITAVAGHSGAKAVWESRIASASSSATTTVKSNDQLLTASEVAKHSSESDCWSVVNGNVYDLTQFVSRHPGGSGNIKLMCGKDATSAFTGQHGSSARPNNELSNLLIGKLSRATTGLNQAPAGSGDGEEEEENE